AIRVGLQPTDGYKTVLSSDWCAPRPPLGRSGPRLLARRIAAGCREMDRSIGSRPCSCVVPPHVVRCRPLEGAYFGVDWRNTGATGNPEVARPHRVHELTSRRDERLNQHSLADLRTPAERRCSAA